MFVNRMPRFEVLDADSLDVLDRGWRRILTEIGIDFGLPGRVEGVRAAGQAVDGTVVRLDPEVGLEQAAEGPRECDVRAPNEARTLHVGGDPPASASCYAPP